MGTQVELKTIAAAARGKGGRTYDGPDSSSRGAFHAAFAALALTGVALLKKLLWGSEDASAATKAEAVERDDEGSAAAPAAGSDLAPVAGEDVEQIDEEPLRDAGVQGSARPKSMQAGGWPDADGLSGSDTAARLMHLKAVNDNAGGATIVALPSAPASQPPEHRTISLEGGGGAGKGHHPTRGTGDTELGDAAEGGTANGPGTPVGSTGSNSQEKSAGSSASASTGTGYTERINHAPVVSRSVTLPALVANHALLITLGDLLRHASDADGDIMAVADLVSSSGTLQDNGDGTWTFKPAIGDESEVLFTYDVTDGNASVAETATLDLVASAEPACGITLAGSDGDDVIVGTPCADELDVGSGHDTVYAGAGHDVIHGGGGNDTIFGGDGDDVIQAGGGDDVVHAGSGNDIVFAGAGNDIVMGGAGDDVLHGEAGDDVLAGEAGNDVAIGGAGNDRFVAGGGDAVTAGPAGGDAPGDHGWAGTDGPAATSATPVSAATTTPADQDGVPAAANAPASDNADQAACAIEPGSAATAAATCDGPAIAGPSDAQAASATATAAASVQACDGDDVYDGGAGIDTLDLSQVSTDTFVDLADGIACGAEIGQDSLIDIENVVCGSGDDTVVDSSCRNVLSGGGGNDRFVFNGLDQGSGDVADADQIVDFEHGDKIDVSRIVALDDDCGGQPLEFLGEISSDIKDLLDIGKLGFRFEISEDGEHTILYGRTGAEEFNDFIVDLFGRHELTTEDFYGVR